jgi:nucleotide-binding universal stress UspA family protein
MKILIADDGSEWARAAMADLTRAGLAGEIEAEVISAVDVWIPPKTEGEQPSLIPKTAGVERAITQAQEAISEAEATAAAGAARLLELFPSWRVKSRAVADSPAWAVIKRATDWEADLVVSGSHGQSSISRLFLGSVSQKILVEAPCSVRIGRRNNRAPEEPARLLIGLDGSGDSEAAVAAVAARTWPAGSKARLATAVDLKISTEMAGPEEFRSRWVGADDEQTETWVGRMLAEMSEQLRAAGLQVSTLERFEDPKRLLVDEAKSWEADAIFLGARGQTLIERLFVGSVSAAIAARAHCTVEIIRAK